MPDLEKWKKFLHIEECRCPFEWKSGGILYGVSMGKEWHRMDTAPDCPVHKEIDERA